jgi:hypothetical protein
MDTSYKPFDINKTLLEVALDNIHCDKITHGYCDLYHKYFNELRTNENVRMLEIGVLNGFSLRMFKSYFHPNTYIHGIDINESKHLLPNDIHFTKMDTRNIDSLKTFANTQGKWDIIIDDGGHDMCSQQYSIQYLWDVLKPGGYFVMEDIHSSFMQQFKPQDSKTSTYHLMKCLSDVNSTFYSPWITTETFEKLRNDIDIVEFYQRDPNLWTDSITCIVRKRS